MFSPSDKTVYFNHFWWWYFWNVLCPFLPVLIKDPKYNNLFLMTHDHGHESVVILCCIINQFSAFIFLYPLLSAASSFWVSLKQIPVPTSLITKSFYLTEKPSKYTGWGSYAWCTIGFNKYLLNKWLIRLGLGVSGMGLVFRPGIVPPGTWLKTVWSHLQIMGGYAAIFEVLLSKPDCQPA